MLSVLVITFIIMIIMYLYAWTLIYCWRIHNIQLKHTTYICMYIYIILKVIANQQQPEAVAPEEERVIY